MKLLWIDTALKSGERSSGRLVQAEPVRFGNYFVMPVRQITNLHKLSWQELIWIYLRIHSPLVLRNVVVSITECPSAVLMTLSIMRRTTLNKNSRTRRLLLKRQLR